MKRLTLVALAISLLLSCTRNNVSHTHSGPTVSPTPMTDATLRDNLLPKLKLDRQVYAPAQEMKVTAIAASLSDTAWVWIVPEAQKPQIITRPAKSLEAYASFGPSKSELKTAAPVAAGRYAICLYAASTNSPELTRTVFEVKALAP